MALFDKLIKHDPTLPKIPIHAFYAMMREFARGEITKQYIVDNCNLDAADETDLDWLIAQYNARTAGLEREQFMQGFWSILMMAEIESYPGYADQAEVVTKITSL